MRIDQNKLRDYVLIAETAHEALLKKMTQVRDLRADVRAAEDAADRERLNASDAQSPLPPPPVWSQNGGLVPQIQWTITRRRKKRKRVVKTADVIATEIAAAEKAFNEAVAERDRNPTPGAEEAVTRAADVLSKARRQLLKFQRLTEVEKRVVAAREALAQAECDLEILQADWNAAARLAERCKAFAEQHRQLPDDLR